MQGINVSINNAMVNKKTVNIFSNLALLLVFSAAGLLSGEYIVRKFNLSKTFSSYVSSRLVCNPLNMLKDGNTYKRIPKQVFKGPRGQTYKINSAGFRDKDFPALKGAQTTRVAFLGDSVTEGFGVGEDERFSGRVEQMFNGSGRKVESMNFGVAGYSPLDEVCVLRRHVLIYSPDLVILQFCYNDFLELQKQVQGVRGLEGLSGKSGRGLAAGNKIKNFLRAKSALYLFISERYNYFTLKFNLSNPQLNALLKKPPGAGFEAAESIFREFSGICGSGNAVPVIAYVPLEIEVLAKDTNKACYINNQIRRISERSGVYFIDVLGYLRNYAGASIYLDDCHLSGFGHYRVAEVITKNIAKFLK